MYLQLVPRALTFLALSFLVACSGGDTPPNFQDPLSALDVADGALASDKPVTAAAGYQFALDHGDKNLQIEALGGLIRVGIREGQEGIAVQHFQRLSSEFADGMEFESSLAMLTEAAAAKQLELANTILNHAWLQSASHRELLLPTFREVLKIASEAPGSKVDTAALGYVGGDDDESHPLAIDELVIMAEYLGDWRLEKNSEILSAAQLGATERIPQSWFTDFQALATGENALDALSVFENLKATQPELLTSENLLKMTIYAIEVAKSVELTQPILDYAMATLPKEIGKFGRVDAAIYRMQNPSVADLSLDGAHAPIEGTVGSEADGTEEE